MSVKVMASELLILPSRTQVRWTPGDGEPDRCTITFGGVPPWRCTLAEWREVANAVEAGFDSIPHQMEVAAAWNTSKSAGASKAAAL
jgi:hypothetical protein